jgi:hypothetical protein
VIVFKKFLIFVLRNKLVELTREREVSLIFIKSKDNLRAKNEMCSFHCNKIRGNFNFTISSGAANLIIV